jgi:hypothetical protein
MVAGDVEKLYDRAYADTGRVRVAGPFTVESAPLPNFCRTVFRKTGNSRLGG